MARSRRRLKRVRAALGTFVEIAVEASAPAREIERWIAAGFDAVAEVERAMSAHAPDSELARLNGAAPGRWVAVSPPTREVLAAANELYRRSRGAFDIRCGAVLARRGLLPPARGAGARLPRRGAPQPVALRGAFAAKTGPWRLDLGGIAKGYAVDRAAARVRAAAGGRAASGCVNAGGDLRLWGRRPQRVAVRLGGFARATLRLRAGAAATSETRRLDGTGRGLAPAAQVRMPGGGVSTSRSAVTVIARRCMHADALAKVALLASRARARACLSSYGARALVFGRGARAGVVA